MAANVEQKESFLIFVPNAIKKKYYVLKSTTW